VVIERQDAEGLLEEVDFFLPSSVVVFKMEGPFFFGAAERLETTLESVGAHADTLVLRMGQVPLIDATGMQSLWDLLDNCKRHNTRLVLCEARPNVLEKLKRAGLVGQIGKENVIPRIQALRAK